MKNKQVLSVINPSTGIALTDLPVDDVDSAVNKLSKAQALFADKSRHLRLDERIAILEKLAMLVEREHEGLSTWQVFKSIMMSFFGVQKEEIRTRDFTQGKPSQFIIIGLLITVGSIFSLYLLVQVVLFYASAI